MRSCEENPNDNKLNKVIITNTAIVYKNTQNKEHFVTKTSKRTNINFNFVISVGTLTLDWPVTGFNSRTKSKVLFS